MRGHIYIWVWDIISESNLVWLSEIQGFCEWNLKKMYTKIQNEDSERNGDKDIMTKYSNFTCHTQFNKHWNSKGWNGKDT